MQSRITSWRWYALAPLIALAGGVFGIPAAMYNEFLHGTILVAFVGAPIIEESLKPSGIYLLLGKRPEVLRSQLYTASLTALGGLAFALIENLLYLEVYWPHLSAEQGDPSSSLVLWRYTVCVALHVTCSFIFGLGINEKLKASVKGEIKFLSTGKRFFITAIVLHGLYNITAVILESKWDLW